MSSALWPILGTLLGTLITVAGGIFVKRIDARATAETARSAAEATPFAELSDQYVELAQQIRDIRRQMNVVIVDRDAMARYIYEFSQWEATGSRPPRPRMPLHLKDAFAAAGVPWPCPDEPTAPTPTSSIRSTP